MSDTKKQPTETVRQVFATEIGLVSADVATTTGRQPAESTASTQKTLVQRHGDLYDQVDAALKQMRHYMILQADIAANWQARGATTQTLRLICPKCGHEAVGTEWVGILGCSECNPTRFYQAAAIESEIPDCGCDGEVDYLCYLCAKHAKEREVWRAAQAAPPPADETLPAGVPLIECPIWECSEVGPHKHGDGIYARTYTRAAQPSGAQGEGLLDVAQEFMEEIELALICHGGMDTYLPKRAIPAWLKFRTKLKTLVAAREPAAPTPGTEGRDK